MSSNCRNLRGSDGRILSHLDVGIREIHQLIDCHLIDNLRLERLQNLGREELRLVKRIGVVVYGDRIVIEIDLC